MTANQLLASLGLIFWTRRPKLSQKEQVLASFVPDPRSTAREQPAKAKRVGFSFVPDSRSIAREEVRLPTNKEVEAQVEQKDSVAIESSNQPTTQPVKSPPKTTDLQDLVSFRYEALVIPPVAVLYEITGELELPSKQRELLDTMLSRCGLKGSPVVRSLPWPPPFPLDEENESAEQAYLGFLTSLIENNGCEWLILMGKSRLSTSIPAINIIKLDSLGLLMQEPKRRIKAWEELAPLRDSIS